MAPKTLKLCGGPRASVSSYVFNVDTETGLDSTHLEDLTDLLRQHASRKQLVWILAVLEGVLRGDPPEDAPRPPLGTRESPGRHGDRMPLW